MVNGAGATPLGPGLFQHRDTGAIVGRNLDSGKVITNPPQTGTPAGVLRKWPIRPCGLLDAFRPVRMVYCTSEVDSSPPIGLEFRNACSASG